MVTEVVTAEKRTKRIQDAPISANALSGAAFGATDAADRSLVRSANRWTFNRTLGIPQSPFVRFSELLKAAYTSSQLGLLIRAERKARGRSQQWVAERVGCRRQTVADLEAGRNVALNILMGTLASLGKGLSIVDED